MKHPKSFILVLAATLGVLAGLSGSNVEAIPGPDKANQPSGGATITGAVSEEDSGDPVAGLVVGIYDVGGVAVDFVETDSSGKFSTSGLLPGIYYVGTDSHFGFKPPAGLLGEIYDDAPCPLGCNAVTGTPIVLDDDGTAFVEIALSTGGSVSGTVDAEASGEPLPEVRVELLDTTGSSIADGVTGPDGSYAIRGLPAGTYFARTLARSGFLDELYDGSPCVFARCDPARGTPVVVRQGVESKDVDFTLARGGVLSGTVVDAATSEPISGVRVELYDDEGGVAAARTDAAGAYAAGGLPAGRYFVLTSDSAGFLGELYDGLSCVPGECDPEAGTGVTVRPGSATAGIDFALERGGAISGVVTAEETGEAVRGVTVSVDGGARIQASDRTDGEGGYRVDGLRSGSYFVRVASSSELVGELHERIPCPGGTCDPTTGTPVVVEAGEEVRIDFDLATGGSVSGQVIDEDTGEPVSGVSILVVSSDYKLAASDRSNEDGRYRATGLPTGSYLAESLRSGDYFSHVFGGGPCPVFAPCDGVTGETVRVEAGTDTGNVDFFLKRGLGISGRVFDETHGFGFPRIFVAAFDEAGTPIASSSTDALGHFRISPLPAGTTYARAGSQFTGIVTDAGLLDELYQDVPCPFATCDVTAGTPIVLEEGSEVSGIDFAMTQGGVLSGSLTDEASGQPIRRTAWVEVFDSSGLRIASETIDRNGNFRVGALPTGTYFARVPYRTGFMGELYGGRPCTVDCDVTAGVPVAVTSGAETSGIDFQLTLGVGFEGTVFREVAGDPYQFRIDVFDDRGSFLGSATPTSPVGTLRRNMASYRVGGLPPGSYFVRVEAPGLIGELYAGVPCPLKCDPGSGTTVTVDADGMTEGVDFHLAAGGSLSGTVTGAATGGGVAGLAILVYDAGGRKLGTTESGADGLYAVDGLPAGTYFVRVPASRGYRGQLFDGTPCRFRTCRVTTGTPVVVEVGEETGGIDFALDR